MRWIAKLAGDTDRASAPTSRAYSTRLRGLGRSGRGGRLVNLGCRRGGRLVNPGLGVGSERTGCRARRRAAQGAGRRAETALRVARGIDDLLLEAARPILGVVEFLRGA